MSKFYHFFRFHMVCWAPTAWPRQRSGNAALGPPENGKNERSMVVMSGHRTIRMPSRLGAMVFAAVLLAGCATAPDPGDAEAHTEYQMINDPGEPTMRAIFSFNRVVDRLSLQPLAAVYRKVLPSVVQRGIHNVLNNLRAPVVLFNDLLQGKLARAGCL